MEYCLFDTKLEAERAMNYVNGHLGFPIVGRNARTGKLDPTKQQTTKWVDTAQEFKDGKWGFQTVPISFLKSLGEPEENRADYNNTLPGSFIIGTKTIDDIIIDATLTERPNR